MQLPTRKALVIRLSSLGDVVLASSAIGPLRAAGYEVALVTKKEFAPLWAHHPDVSQIFGFDKSKGEEAARNEFLQWAKSQNFSLALDLQDSWRTWRWRRPLRALMPLFVAHKSRWREIAVLVFRLGHWFGYRRGGRALRFRRVAEDALASRGEYAPTEGALTKLHTSAEERAAVARLLPEGDFAVLLPASAWRGKEWPYFKELAAIFSRQVPVVVLGARQDSLCGAVAAAARAVNPLSRSLHGHTSIRESMAILAQARWIVGNDTGMVHVAEALGKDVAMVEGPTHPFMGFSPYRAKSELLSLPLACRPCSKSGRICFRFGSRLCLKGLKVSQVVQRLKLKGYPC